MERVIQIQAPHFCASIVLVNNEVVEAAPIVKYMVGWQLDHIERYCAQKRWRLEE